MDAGETHIEVLCCYVREDHSHLIEFKKRLIPWENQHLIGLSADIDVSPGTNWRKKITDYLDAAQLVLLLVSPDFLLSEFCLSAEMTSLMQQSKRGEVHVIPLIFRSCLWEELPFGELEALPTGTRAVFGPEWHDKDEAFYDVARGIRKVVEALSQSSQNKEGPQKKGSQSRKMAASARDYKPTQRKSRSVPLVTQASNLDVVVASSQQTGSATPVTLDVDAAVSLEATRETAVSPADEDSVFEEAATSEEAAVSPVGQDSAQRAVPRSRPVVLLRKIGYWVGMLALILFGCSGGVCAVVLMVEGYFQNAAAPSNLVQEYCTAIKLQDYQTASGYFGDSSLGDYRSVSINGRSMIIINYINAASAVDRQKGKVTACSLDTSDADMSKSPYDNSYNSLGSTPAIRAAKIQRDNISYIVYFEIEPANSQHANTTIMDVSNF